MSIVYAMSRPCASGIFQLRIPVERVNPTVTPVQVLLCPNLRKYTFLSLMKIMKLSYDVSV